MRSSYVLIATINFFNDSYDEAIKLLPNKDQKGSLYYYLDMYVNGDVTKIDKWNKSKLDKFIENGLKNYSKSRRGRFDFCW